MLAELKSIYTLVSKNLFVSHCIQLCMDEHSGDCKKCTTEIPLNAQRCPQCGYEPGKPVLGAIGKIIGALILIGAIFQMLLGVVSLLTIFSGVPISSSLLAGGIFLAAGIIQAGIANWLGKFGTYYAAEQPGGKYTDEDSNSFKEDIQEGYEQGVAIRERRQKRVDQLSSGVFSSAIFAGIGLLLLSFIVVGTDVRIGGVPTEDIFIIPFAISMAIIPSTVLSDLGRVNRLYNANYRWWVWVVPAMIPFIGFIPAVVWIWRRRKMENTNQD